jgi:hypothetical protein
MTTLIGWVGCKSIYGTSLSFFMNFGTTPSSFFFPWVSNILLKDSSLVEGMRGGDYSPPPKGHIWNQGNDFVGRMHHNSGPLGIWD